MSKLPMEIQDLPEEMFEERAPQRDASHAGPSSFEERRSVGSQTEAPPHATAPYSWEAGFDLFSIPEPQLFRPISVESFQLEISPEEDTARRSNNATASRPSNQSGAANRIDVSWPSQALNLRSPHQTTLRGIQLIPNLEELFVPTSSTLPIANSIAGLGFDSSSRLNWVSGQSDFHPFSGNASGSGPTQASQFSLPLIRSNIPSLPLENHLPGNNPNKRPREENVQLPGQLEAGESSRPAKRLKVTWWDNNYFPHASNLPLNNNSNIDQNPRPLPISNRVYDPLYGRAGLPIDPHLRLFQARRGTGNDGL